MIDYTNKTKYPNNVAYKMKEMKLVQRGHETNWLRKCDFQKKNFLFAYITVVRLHES